LKKPAGSVRFYKPKTEPRPKKNKKKTEPNRQKTEPKPKKPSQTGLNRFCPKNRTELKPVGLNWFRFFFKKFGLVTFLFYKNRTEPKMITPSL
jgi:hypothetical protein